MKLAKNVFAFGLIVSLFPMSAVSVHAEDGVIAIEEIKREDKIDLSLIHI